ncbi:MAG: PorT family protein [Cyclobacteriaceae bacterium]|nr:PorT family protein [Cyclobacteriaceae bacterium]
MKKVVLSLVVLLISASAFAQLSGGAKAGLNLANWGGDVEGTDMLTSFHVGGYVNFALSDAISLQPELLFNSVGAKIEDVSLVTNYISIPVMLLYNVNENFNIQAGPQIGLLMSAKAKFEGESEDIKDAFTGTDFGVNLGLGANFGKLNATARYCLGLANVFEDSGDEKGTTSVIQISLGYKLFGN